MLQCTHTVMRAMALSLDLPEDYFDHHIVDDSYWIMRVIGYPPLPCTCTSTPLMLFSSERCVLLLFTAPPFTSHSLVRHCIALSLSLILGGTQLRISWAPFSLTKPRVRTCHHVHSVCGSEGRGDQLRAAHGLRPAHTCQSGTLNNVHVRQTQYCLFFFWSSASLVELCRGACIAWHWGEKSNQSPFLILLPSCDVAFVLSSHGNSPRSGHLPTTFPRPVVARKSTISVRGAEPFPSLPSHRRLPDSQDTTKGALQVRNSDGLWMNADPIEGCLVCNIGDMFNILTNNRYRSTVHRYQASSGCWCLSLLSGGNRLDCKESRGGRMGA